MIHSLRMKENLSDIYKLLTGSEKLLRLLFYIPNSPLDNPLDLMKPNILDMDDKDKWDIILDRIKTTIKVDDLDNTPKCRVLFYAGKRKSTGNYYVSSQEVVFDIFTHIDFDEIDLRLSWICDTINDLLFDERITGIGKVNFKDGGQIGAPNGYVAYRMVYEIWSGNT